MILPVKTASSRRVFVAAGGCLMTLLASSNAVCRGRAPTLRDGDVDALIRKGVVDIVAVTEDADDAMIGDEPYLTDGSLVAALRDFDRSPRSGLAVELRAIAEASELLAMRAVERLEKSPEAQQLPGQYETICSHAMHCLWREGGHDDWFSAQVFTYADHPLLAGLSMQMLVRNGAEADLLTCIGLRKSAEDAALGSESWGSLGAFVLASTHDAFLIDELRQAAEKLDAKPRAEMLIGWASSRSNDWMFVHESIEEDLRNAGVFFLHRRRDVPNRIMMQNTVTYWARLALQQLSKSMPTDVAGALLDHQYEKAMPGTSDASVDVSWIFAGAAKQLLFDYWISLECVTEFRRLEAERKK